MDSRIDPDHLCNDDRGSYTIAKEFPRIIDATAEMKGTRLSEAEQRVFGEAALIDRYGDDKNPIRPNQIIQPHRSADVGGSVWSTFNVIQENVIRGGLQGMKRTDEGRIRRSKSRPINGIDQNVSFKRAMWTLAEGMQRLKAAAYQRWGGGIAAPPPGFADNRRQTPKPTRAP